MASPFFQFFFAFSKEPSSGLTRKSAAVQRKDPVSSNPIVERILFRTDMDQNLPGQSLTYWIFAQNAVFARSVELAHVAG